MRWQAAPESPLGPLLQIRLIAITSCPASAMPELPVHFTGLAAVSALGQTPDAQLAALAAGKRGLRPLRDLPEASWASVSDLPAGWLPERASWLRGRRYGAASNLAVRIARAAADDAGWGPAELADAWIFAGSSRANTGELLGEWSQRRPIAKFRASNSLHSEVAAAISIELGARGPWQMLANGCSAGLDAAGFAWLALRQGLARRALVVSVELPLCETLLRGFADTGLLASASSVNDPYHPDSAGFFPAEAAAAFALETQPCKPGPELLWYAANSDAYDSIALPEDGLGLARLLTEARSVLDAQGLRAAALCPHANGTASNRVAESAALRQVFPEAATSLFLPKPATGHSLGASGALELALLAAALRHGHLPANPHGLSTPAPHLTAAPTAVALSDQDAVLKVALGMGGHNAVVALRPFKVA